MKSADYARSQYIHLKNPPQSPFFKGGSIILRYGVIEFKKDTFFSLWNEIYHNIIVFKSRSLLAFLPEYPIIPL